MRLNSLAASSTLALALALTVVLAPVAEALADPLQLTFTADKVDYTRGEQALMTLKVKNTSALPLVINFSNGQQYDFAATDANGTTVWTWSNGKSFPPSGSSRTLAAGETWTIQESWTFVGNDGQGVFDGAFTVSGTFLGNYLGKSGTKTGSQAITLTTPDPIQVAFTTDKSVYRRSDKPVFTLTVTNFAPYAVTVVFPTAQLYDFGVANASGSAVWTWSNGKSFDQNPQELVLGAGETVQFQQTWSLANNSGWPVGDGTYTASGTFLGTYYGQIGTKGGQSQIQVRTLF
ncbi:MAG TPA: BsuPI-related putative proteinase inhibitor [Myxococcaceae bacterium]|jgi:hypothetical protein